MKMGYGADVTFVGGCIRLDPDGVYLHENSAHASVGIRNVWIERGFLKVSFYNSNPVVSIQVSTDETIGGRKGIIAGGSGGVNDVYIRFYDTRINRALDLSDKDDYARVASSLSNVWLLVTHLA